MEQPIIIRKETPEDYTRVVELTEIAFKGLEFSDGKEGKLVENLHQSSLFIPELSLVAEVDGELAGHILFTPIRIENENETFETLSLAPVSVLPEFQKQGIGSRLIEAGHQKAKELGFRSIIVVGHPHYYPRFGYRPASKWGIKAPFDLPSDDVFMATELDDEALKGISGTVIFPAEYGL
ncbi:MAG: N-acetyltransferase [Prolixibacteraceae bacterium]|jgi:predicted N-acetyltransferase YhbS